MRLHLYVKKCINTPQSEAFVPFLSSKENRLFPVDRVSSLAEWSCHWCRGTHDPPHPHLRPRWSDCTRWEWLPTTPLPRPCHPQLQGQKNKGELGRAGQPTGYSETGRCATRERSETVARTFYMRHLFPLCECFECLGASLPQALHRPSTAHQGCGSHVHTLGDIFVLFLSVPYFFSKPHSRTCTVPSSE